MLLSDTDKGPFQPLKSNWFGFFLGMLEENLLTNKMSTVQGKNSLCFRLQDNKLTNCTYAIDISCLNQTIMTSKWCLSLSKRLNNWDINEETTDNKFVRRLCMSNPLWKWGRYVKGCNSPSRGVTLGGSLTLISQIQQKEIYRKMMEVFKG